MRFVVNSTKLLLLASAISLAACGSGGDGDGGSLTGMPTDNGGIGGGGGTGGDGSEPPVAPQFALGASSGSMFQQGAMELGSNSVSFNGEVPVSVNIVNQSVDN